MTDFHAHVLPGIDDGSSSLDESIALLEILHKDGVSLVCATPHFNALYDEPEAFLAKRNEAYGSLSRAIEGKNLPRVIVGAEVTYFNGISNMGSIADFCIEGSKYLLIEMPPEVWSDYTVNDLVKLAITKDIKPVIAHVERCLYLQTGRTLQRLRSVGVLMQANASFFINRKTRRRALGLLKRGEIHFLGSDCHGLTFRPPHYAEAVKIIKDKFGDNFRLNTL
ncbi:MAG: hypothetical protein IKC34_04195 [Clostridia bacterium]|nr:hypothetical protein [Clostridia bacterium]